ncbi:DeoR/GlpR family DNA-binding transcription regulator [Microbacterium sp. gxy059]|uniref:DeoR/GlpR family DNA-binding transcription regulator n=1 Tax=Microbacterium sp. gxy059 TaxID=2957199 RepID=UPI003D97EC64
MYQAERHTRIIGDLRAHGRVAVADLADRFGITTETVRRDLAALERSGLLRRVHGGAVSPELTSVVEAGLAERETRRSAEKRAIADRAVQVIPDGFTGSVLVDAGTTTGALLEPLAARVAGRRVEVVTNAVAHAAQLAGRDGLGLTVLGGRVRSVTGAAVGASTVRDIEELRPDLAFIGANGLSAMFGLSTPDREEADVKRAMVRQARRVVVLVDASKFGVESLQRFAELADIDVVVADRAPEGDLAAALRAAGTEVRTA